MLSFIKKMCIVLSVCAGLYMENVLIAHADQVEPKNENDAISPVSTDDLRDPFWPVGYVPPTRALVGKNDAPVAASEEQREKALKSIRFGGVITSGDKYYATVNGALVQAGDVVSVTIDGRVFRFRVRSVSLKGVRFVSAD